MKSETQAKFSYNSKLERTKSTIESDIEVSYISNDMIAYGDYVNLYDKFDNYLDFDRTDNINEVVSSIREIFKDLDEEKLRVLIKREKDELIALYDESNTRKVKKR